MIKADNVRLLIGNRHLLEHLKKDPEKYVGFRTLHHVNQFYVGRSMPLVDTINRLESLVNGGFIDKKTEPARYRIQEKGQTALEKLEELRDVCE